MTTSMSRTGASRPAASRRAVQSRDSRRCSERSSSCTAGAESAAEARSLAARRVPVSILRARTIRSSAASRAGTWTARRCAGATRPGSCGPSSGSCASTTCATRSAADDHRGRDSAVQEWMGHADIQTMMRYLHYAPRAEDAATLGRGFRVRVIPGALSGSGGRRRRRGVEQLRRPSGRVDRSGALRQAGAVRERESGGACHRAHPGDGQAVRLGHGLDRQQRSDETVVVGPVASSPASRPRSATFETTSDQLTALIAAVAARASATTDAPRSSWMNASRAEAPGRTAVRRVVAAPQWLPLSPRRATGASAAASAWRSAISSSARLRPGARSEMIPRAYSIAARRSAGFGSVTCAMLQS
jgi:hypothetical protein